MMYNYKNDIIIGICGKLQLQHSKYKLADDRYQTIAEIIQSDNAFKNIELNMYPHGSFRLKTTVKPLSENEYDLDFVVEIPQSCNMTPTQLYDNIYRILSNDGIHKGMVEKKSRCVRINYANEFHMDIMPGQVFNKSTHEIIVPDRKLLSWYHHSNPIGFAEWFEQKSETKATLVKMITEQAEPIVDQEDVSKLEPLRRAVQLVKRYRDIYCDKNSAEPVRSIVICALMGQISYSGYDEISILIDFCMYVDELIKKSERTGQPFEVRNPIINNEILTEKWIENQQNYKDFVSMMTSLKDDVIELSSLSETITVGTKLKAMFGETITTEVIKEHSEMISNARKNGVLGVDKYGRLTAINENAGSAGSAGSAGNAENVKKPKSAEMISLVRPNTFYGG